MQAETLNCAISYAELEGLMSADKATIICDQVADHRCAWLSTHLELVHTEESRSLRVTAHPKPCVQAQAPMRTRAELQELEERRNEQIAAKKDAATRALLAGLARTKHAKEQHDLDRSSRIEIGRAARKAVHERLKRESEELARKEAEREALREMRIAEKELERRQRARVPGAASNRLGNIRPFRLWFLPLFCCSWCCSCSC
ncbi:unnamed protein product [Polarella glacialis]|uniref:Uncharacterized protein n=1 Tax=Polarella glacialis TaxID=89957 RepID=A0A813KUF0_POLGL|nr:unnamed protein product [Polarella glacialis]